MEESKPQGTPTDGAQQTQTLSTPFQAAPNQALTQSGFKTMDHLVKIDVNHPIVIEVRDPQFRESKMGKYTVFTVRGSDQQGEFEVERRYSDFFHFRNALVNRWPGCYIPPIPSKKFFGNTDPQFVEERRRFLQYFCQRLSELKQMYYSDESRIFFRSRSSDVESLLTGLPKLNSGDICNRFKSAFSYLSGREITQELVLGINQFKQFLEKNAKQNLESMKRSAAALLETKTQFTTLFGQLTSTFLPDYEKTVAHEYTGQGSKLLMFSQNDDIIQKSTDINISHQANTFTVFYDFIKTESKDIKAFLEAIYIKESYEVERERVQKKMREVDDEIVNLKAGKTTFKSIFASGSKDELLQRLERTTKDLHDDLENITILIDLMTLILGYVEIDKFKTEKQKRYYETLIRFSEQENKLNQQYQGLWDGVAKVVAE